VNIDTHGARGSFSFASKGDPDSSGEHKNLTVSVSVSASVPPAFLDQYLEGHNTGAQPSAVFWRQSDPKDKDSAIYARYMGIKSIALEVSTERRYALKLRSPPPQGWEDGEKNFPGYLEACLVGGKVKALKALPVAGGASIELKFLIPKQLPDMARDLAALSLLEEVLVDVWLVDRDMFSDMPPDADDEDPDAGDDGDEGEGAGDDGEEAPE